MDTQLEKLGKVLEVLETDRASTEEVAQALAMVLQVVSDVKEALEKRVGESEASTDREVGRLDGRIDNTDQEITNVKKDLTARIERVKTIKGDKGEKGEPGKDGKDGRDGVDGHIKDLSPQEVRDSLELLQGDERLDKSAIKGLEELIKELEKKIGKGGTTYVGGGGSSGGGRVVKEYDLSASLNGVTKTFSLPAFYRVISVDSSSAPFTLRKTVDYTTNASAMTITFTSEIDAATTLATGQTVIIIYSE